MKNLRSFSLLAALLAAATIPASCKEDEGKDTSGQKLQTNSGISPSEDSPSENSLPRYVLAFSWQPAFCEGAVRKRECRTQTQDRFDATNFTLHGLWPQPAGNQYCNVPEDQVALDKAGKWRDLTSGHISDVIWEELKRVMPGTQSSLHRHEWIKHGTCYGGDIDEYYADSLWLMQKINNSSLRSLFADNIGREIDINAIKAAFEKDFGKSSGDRLRVSCQRDQNSGRQLIVEITLGLVGKIEGSSIFSDLVMASDPTDPGCPSGIVDPAGLQ